MDEQNAARVPTHPVQPLTGGAMAVLACQRFGPAQLVLDLPAMTAPLPFDIEILIVFMDTVRLSISPLILLSVSVRAGLELMSFVSQVSVLLRNMSVPSLLFAVTSVSLVAVRHCSHV